MNTQKMNINSRLIVATVAVAGAALMFLSFGPVPANALPPVGVSPDPSISATPVPSQGTSATPSPLPPESYTECEGAPDIPTFNPFPVTFTGQNCHDYPVIDARIEGGAFSKNINDLNDGLTAHAGDVIDVYVYVHNGAVQNPPQTDAKNVRVVTKTPLKESASHTIKAQLMGSNIATKAGTFTIHTSPNEKLELVEGSGAVYDKNFRHVLQSGLTIGNGITQLGKMPACFEHLRWVTFKVRVVAEPTPTPTPTPVNISCPLNASDGVIFNFPDRDTNYIVANKSVSESIMGPYNFSLAPGVYKVTLAAFDDHTAHPGQYQPNEQYFIELENGSSVIAKTGNSADIADNAIYSAKVANEALAITGTVSQLLAKHAAYPSSNPNSNTPVCAGFKKISDLPKPNLTIEKLGRNTSTDPMTELADTTPASPEDVIRFNLRITNTGNADADNVIVSDELPEKMSYIDGSTKNLAGDTLTDGITSGGINIGTLKAGKTEFIAFNAKIATAASFDYGTTTLTNTGKVKADGLSEITDTASVEIELPAPAPLVCSPETQNIFTGETATFTASGGTPPYSWVGGDNPTSGKGETYSTVFNTAGMYIVGLYDYVNDTGVGCMVIVSERSSSDLSITKTVRNISDGETSENLNTEDADPEEIVEFIIKVSNTGDNTAQNVIASDTLPSRLTYLANTTTVDGNGASDGIASGGINVGDIESGQTKTIKFLAQVADESEFSVGTITLENTASANADNADSVQDNAFVEITIAQALECSPYSQTVEINQAAVMNATGGTGNYVWSAPNGNPSNGTGSAFATSYANSGTYLVSLSDGASNPVYCTVIVTQNANPSLNISKMVSNVSQATGTYDLVSARPDEVVEFTIQISNTGDADAQNVTVSDDLPSRLIYLANTTTIDGNSASDGIVSGGINIGSIPEGHTKTVKFRAQVEDESEFNVGTTTLINNAYAHADNISDVNDTATVQVSKEEVYLSCSPSYQNIEVNQWATLFASGGNGSYTWTAPEGDPSTGYGSSFSTSYGTTGTKTITLWSAGQSRTCTVYVNSASSALNVEKLVKNVSDNTSTQNSVNANPLETIEFTIRISNDSANTVYNAWVRDNLPSGLTYMPGTAEINSQSAGDGITSNGLFLGNISPWATKTVKFRAQVREESFFTQSSTTLTNSAYSWGDNIGTRSDTAFVTVDKTYIIPGPEDILSIHKFGRDISKGQTAEQTQVSANPNHTLDFIIRVRNLADFTVHNVIVRDALPYGLSYIPRTTSINNTITTDGIVSGGINIGSLAPNQEAVIRFNALVSGPSAFSLGTTSITNTAFVKGDGIGEIGASLPISIVRGSVLGIVGSIPTGANLLLMTVLLSALVTAMYAAYTQSNVFLSKEAKALAKSHRADSSRFNFAL